MVEALKAAGIPVPAKAHLYWEGEGLHLVVVLDGAFHDDPTVAG